MNVRNADINDAFAISRICTDDLGYECSEEFVLNRLKNIDGSRETVFTAEIDGTVFGYIHAEIYNTLYFQSMINILGLAVSHDHRRQGIGKALISRAESWGKEHGINIVRLNSGYSRKEAHEFYRAMGYDDEKLQMRFLKNLD
ncbi:MAG: GNAT family N-acetyltransferase [Oscillospiraceae bacterium]|nr:GNAT family N-acetyltransferase [Oscillospiraceae bacterium]